jgi:hypothetical protein
VRLIVAKINGRKYFCAAPWSGLSVDPDGYAKVCCVSQQRIPFVDVESSQSSPDFDNIRAQVIQDLPQENCSQCWRQEALAAGRDWNSRRSIYQPADFFHDLSDPQAHRLQHLDLRWSNTCNLTCVYCGPIYSSKWNDLVGGRSSHRILNQLSDDKISELKFVQLAGGEPLLINSNVPFLERLWRLNPKVMIEVTSNLTCIANNKVFDLLTRFPHVTMIASFESTGKQFEYIRRGAKWNQFTDNIRICADRIQTLQANMVFFPLSATCITAAIDFALDYMPDTNIFIREQIGGQGFDGLSTKAIQYIKTRLALQSPNLIGTVNQQLHDLSIMIKDTKRDHTRLPQYEKFDRLTGSNHRAVFPELYQ